MAEIIQQWQFIGKVNPKLLEDETLRKCRESGITSLQSYVLWSEIEKERGKIDFSSYDILVEKLKKHNLKWVPFLILSPAYSIPEWFHNSPESVYFKCLEHKKESKIQSIWNPNLPKYIDRFLRIFSEHYQDKSIFESITLGISGNWGEAIYPVNGGFNADFHSHLGFWCADKYAEKKYFKVKGKDLPVLEKSFKKTVSSLRKIADKSPPFLKKRLKLILKFNKRKFWFLEDSDYRPKDLEKEEKKKEWLDFVDWYLQEMVNWAEFWLKTARNYFTKEKIYLVTGGTSHPAIGADFSRQCKVAAEYGAGIRITNQTNDYGQSFILTRLVASAARFYGNYFITEEEAVLQSPEGLTMRIFDAVSSGARGIYCKNFISTGGNPCFKRFLPPGQDTGLIESLKRNLSYFNEEKPIIETAVFFPLNSVILRPEILCTFYNQCAKLRDVLDFDLVDENMIKEGILEKYKYLLILSKGTPSGGISEKIREWTKRGGILTQNPREIPNEIDNQEEGVYATRFRDRVLYYNSNNKIIKKEIPFLKKWIEIKPNSIISVIFTPTP